MAARGRRALAALALAALAAALAPRAALAWGFADIEAGLNEWVCSLFATMVYRQMVGAAELLSQIGIEDLLESGFSELMGTDVLMRGAASGAEAPSVTPYWVVREVSARVVVPAACSVLAFCTLAQVARISSRVQAYDAMPAVREVVQLVVFYVVFYALVTRAFDVCEALFGVAQHMAESVGGYKASIASGFGDFEAFKEAGLVSDAASAMVLWVVSLLVYVSAMLACVVGYVVFFARTIQLYVLACFSPISLALLGNEHTRAMGVGFLKAFFAAALAGAVMMVVLAFFPSLVSWAAAGMAASLTEGPLGVLGPPVRMVAVSLLLVFALAKSGSWARDVLGG